MKKRSHKITFYTENFVHHATYPNEYILYFLISQAKIFLTFFNVTELCFFYHGTKQKVTKRF